MMVTLGEYALAGTMLTAVAVLLAAFVHLMLDIPGLARAVRWGMGLMAGLLTLSSIGLLGALLVDNFSLMYVYKHSERTLPVAYKAAAFWAGQEGSLLFWAWLLGIIGAIMAFRFRAKDDREAVVSLGVMALVTGFFAVVMLWAGNPFELLEQRAPDGRGLNPMLQNIAMVAHPPLLFLGYAGFTAPFALLVGAMLGGRKDVGWLPEARTWMVFSWVTLTVGIILGSWWAYVELGWGGYWAWDPVENASLLPWLTGTALLHSAVLATQRGVFKRWTAALIVVSFLLCIFGTYLTRSGVIQSVHAFGESVIGVFFLVLIGLTGVIGALAVLLNLDALRAERPLEDMFSREGFFLIGNVLLVTMTAVVGIGTIYPLISALYGPPVTVGAPFYNKVVMPMAVVLAGLMATGPVLPAGAGAAARAAWQLLTMVFVGGVTAVIVALLGYTSLWALLAGFVTAAVVAAVVIDFVSAVRARRAAGRESAAMSPVLVLWHMRRHWGAQLAHLGLAAIIVGVTGSAIYNEKQTTAVPVDGTLSLRGYTLTYKGLKEERRSNHTAIVATIEVASRSSSFALRPERRFYDRPMQEGQSNSEVAISFGLGNDVYVNLAGWENAGATATIEAIINPLVNWMWIGGILMTLGGLVCMTGRRSVETRAPEAPVEARPTGFPVEMSGRSERQQKAVVR